MKGRINWAFLENLRTKGGHEGFTTQWAEQVYVTLHREPHEGTGRVSDSYWARMSARNTLTMATQRGYLKRVHRGLYRFTRKPRPEKGNADASHSQASR